MMDTYQYKDNFDYDINISINVFDHE